jgi:hypothetical protein
LFILAENRKSSMPYIRKYYEILLEVKNKEDTYSQDFHILFTVTVDLAQIVIGWK